MRYRVKKAFNTAADAEALDAVDLAPGQYVELVEKGLSTWRFSYGGLMLWLKPSQITDLLVQDPVVAAAAASSDDGGGRSERKGGPDPFAEVYCEPKAAGAVNLSHPADYSGDAWHMASAMVLCPSVRVIVSTQTADTKSKDLTASRKFIKFYRDVGLSSQLVDKTSASPVVVKETARTAIEKHREAAYAHCAYAGSCVGGKAGAVYTSTSVLLHALRSNPLPVLTQRLRARLCAGYTNFKAHEAAAKLASRKVPYVLVNMRVAGYNQQHDINAHIYASILAAAEGLCDVVPVGNFNECPWLEKLHPRGRAEAIDPFDFTDGDMRATAYFWARLAEANEIQRGWIEGHVDHAMESELPALQKKVQAAQAKTPAGQLLVAIQAGRPADAKAEPALGAELRAKVVAELKLPPSVAAQQSDAQLFQALRAKVTEAAKASLQASLRALELEAFATFAARSRMCLGVIGGRSGSLDIAAFLGMRTLCWDIHDPEDIEYARLHLAAPFMSVIGFTCKTVKKDSRVNSVCTGENWSFASMRSIDPHVSVSLPDPTSLAQIVRTILTSPHNLVPTGGVSPTVLDALIAPGLGLTATALAEAFDFLRF